MKSSCENSAEMTDPSKKMDDLSTPVSETRRSSERRKNKEEFTMPTRADVWDKIIDMPTKGMNTLRPRKLVNDFVHVQSRYNYDAAYTSGEESPFAISDDDSDTHTKCKSRQQKLAKKRYTENSSKKGRSKNLGNRHQEKSSESLESSDDSAAKIKKQNKVKGTLKKLHMKVSSQKLQVGSPISSDSENEIILRSCPKRPTILDSSDSDMDRNSEKPVKMFSITKKKKNVSILDSSSSNNNTDAEEKCRTSKSSSFGEKDKKPKRGAIGKKSKPAHSKREMGDDNTKRSSLSVCKDSQNVKRAKGKKSSLSSEHSGSVTDDKAHESLANSESEADVSFNNIKKKNRSNIIESEESEKEDVATHTELTMLAGSTSVKKD